MPSGVPDRVAHFPLSLHLQSVKPSKPLLYIIYIDRSFYPTFLSYYRPRPPVCVALSSRLLSLFSFFRAGWVWPRLILSLGYPTRYPSVLLAYNASSPRSSSFRALSTACCRYPWGRATLVLDRNCNSALVTLGSPRSRPCGYSSVVMGFLSRTNYSQTHETSYVAFSTKTWSPTGNQSAQFPFLRERRGKRFWISPRECLSGIQMREKQQANWWGILFFNQSKQAPDFCERLLAEWLEIVVDPSSAVPSDDRLKR